MCVGQCIALLLGQLALLLSNSFLLDGYSTLPIGKRSKAESQHQPGGKTARENISPPTSSLAAPPDERLRFFSWCRCAAWPRGDPAFGLLQHWRAQEQPARPLRQGPAPGLLAEIGVLPDPGDVGIERLGKLVGTLLEPRNIIKKNEIQLRKRFR